MAKKTKENKKPEKKKRKPEKAEEESKEIKVTRENITEMLNKINELIEKTERLDEETKKKLIIDEDDIGAIKKFSQKYIEHATNLKKPTKDLFRQIDKICINIDQIIRGGVMDAIRGTDLRTYFQKTEREHQAYLKGLEENFTALEGYYHQIDGLKATIACERPNIIYYDHTFLVVEPVKYDNAGNPEFVLKENGAYRLRNEVYINIATGKDPEGNAIKDKDGNIISEIKDTYGKIKEGEKAVMRVVLNGIILDPPNPLLTRQDIERELNMESIKKLSKKTKNYLRWQLGLMDFWEERGFNSLYKKIENANIPMLRDQGEYKIGCDRNGWPLEVDKDGACLLDRWEGRSQRKFPKAFIKKFDLLHVSNFISNEYDTVRDDVRDSRYHLFSLTSTDFAMVSNPPYIVPPLLKRMRNKDWRKRGWEWLPAGEFALDDEKMIKDLRRYSMFTRDKNNNIIFESASMGFDTRVPTNLNPGFDKRALKTAIKIAGGVEDKFQYIGRKYYYMWPDHINYFAEKDEGRGNYLDITGAILKVNKDPSITTRGLSMYITDRVTREEETWEYIDKALDKFGEFDYGPRKFPEPGKYEGKFAKRPYHLDLSEVRKAQEEESKGGG